MVSPLLLRSLGDIGTCQKVFAGGCLTQHPHAPYAGAISSLSALPHRGGSWRS